MKRIAVLVDFTDGSKSALKQAEKLSQKFNAEIIGINIAESNEKKAQAEADLSKFMREELSEAVNSSVEIGIGSLFNAVPSVLKKVDPDVVLICTHGIKGMFQHLFGAHILKLVQCINFPCIVIQENNKIDFSQIHKILFPIGPHPEYQTKVSQTSKIAKLLDAEVLVYEIDRESFDDGNLMDKNRQMAKEYFEANHIKYSKHLDELKVISAGFSRQTLEFAVDHNISLISLMANVSKNEVLFGVGDKENFLVNAQGIPILCCNS